MIVVRSILQAKPGKAQELARVMADTNRRAGAEMGTNARWRVLTDLSGPFDTVVIEGEIESLAAWEQGRAKLFASAAFLEGFGRALELIESGGRNELFTIEAEG